MNPLQRLVENELASQGIKRSELVKLMGYRNINGGLRRLDDLLATLDEHERLLPLLNKALNIEDNRLLAAASALKERLVAAKRAAFRPVIQVIPTRRPSDNESIYLFRSPPESFQDIGTCTVRRSRNS